MSTKMTQREAVYQAIHTVFADNGVEFEDGQNASEVLTKEMRDSVHTTVFNGFKEGTVELEATPANQEKLASEAKLNSYVSGLISNWIRKDKRFNGNVSYVPKNPGSRAGQGDSTLKTLRALKKQYAGTPQEVLIDKEINARVMVIASEKAKSTKLSPEQISSLPAELIASLGLADEA
jgi:hypothetical protein